MTHHRSAIRAVLVAALVFLCCARTTRANEANWPQFRGPNCSGHAAEGQTPPVEFGPEQNLLWKTPVPRGHSSPCIWRDSIFVTAFDSQSKKLQVLCLDRIGGKIRWQQTVPTNQIERVHPISSPATATPATDGIHVYAYFGSYGLLSYDFEGNLLWKVPLPVPELRFGSGTSPIVAGDLVILNRDEQKYPCVIAFDRHTGKVVWKTPQPAVSEMGTTGCSTPVLWDDSIVIHRTGEVVAYSLEDGARIWSLSVVTQGKSTPVVGDNVLFVGAWTSFGEPELRVDLPEFHTLVSKYDKDGDKEISKEEFPEDLALARRPEVGDLPGGTVFVKPFFGRIDGDRNTQIDETEWKDALVLLSSFYNDHGLLAIRSGGNGGITGKYIAWQVKKDVAEVPSPLYYDRHVYMVKNGGVVSCIGAQDGKLLYRERLGSSGPYYSSPIAAGGKVYIASAKGVITVLATGEHFNILAKNDMREPVFATPAVVQNTLYVRTRSHMYAFGE